MFRKFLTFVISALLVLLPVRAAVTEAAPLPAVHANSPAPVVYQLRSGGFSGGYSSRGYSSGSHAYSSYGSFGSGYSSYSTGGTYHSGYRSPSPSVSRGTYGSYGPSYGSRFSGLGSHLFSFGAGWLLGSLMHPFGGYYGFGYHPFSLFGFLVDLILIGIVLLIVRRIFFRR